MPELVTAWEQAAESDPLKQPLAGQIAALRDWDYRWSAASVPTSLAVYWGEEAGRRGNAHPIEPPPPAPSSQAKTGGFSFDEFFAGGKPGAPGATSEGGGADPASSKTPGASRSSGRTQRPPEDEVEADQFQQWLKKLKS